MTLFSLRVSSFPRLPCLGHVCHHRLHFATQRGRDAEPLDLRSEFVPVGVRRGQEERVDQHHAIESVGVSMDPRVEEKGGETNL